MVKNLKTKIHKKSMTYYTKFAKKKLKPIMYVYACMPQTLIHTLFNGNLLIVTNSTYYNILN